MGTGTSKGRPQPASGSSNASQPGATSSGRGGGAGGGGTGGGGGGGRGCGRNLVDAYDEWLLSWLSSLPPPETYEEENDDNDDDGPAAEGGAGAGAGGEGGAGAEAGGAGGEGGAGGGGEGEAPAGGDDGGGGGGGSGGSGSGPATTDTPAQPRLPSLKITGVSLIARFNNSDHKTDDYEYDKSAGRDLIVRRGQEFKIKVLLARPFREKKERIFLQFSTKAKVARPMDGTRIALDINGSYKDDDWSAKVDSAEGNTIMVTVKSAPNAIVGSYSVTVKVESKTSGLETIFPQDKKIMVLFNPWCEKDTVYMAENADREEYVLADSGSIWRGTAERNRPKPWNFGQFDLDVHRVVFELLEKYVSARERRSPVKVSRWFSFIVCEEILEGNWSRNYEGGTSPVMWNGSVKIIEEYARIRDNVKYGQCWVFSGLLTTFLRCVGIPARSVTNFDSAHDTESNMTIDRYLDSEGDKLEEHFFGMVGSSRTVYDSIWNFHVWNEAWMTRPDLDKGYDGWQAVDSTPQEQSEGKYQCGPAPVKAVKEGKVNQGYDTGFVFAEVNADDVRWLVEPFPNHRDGLNFTLLSINKNRTGHVISTKMVGSDKRNDITLEYKHKEGSDKERDAVEEAVSRGINRGIYSDDGKHDDVTISITCKDDLWIGRPFNVEIETKNESDHVQEIRLKTEIDSCDYTGGNKATIKTERMEIVLQGKESVTNTLHIDYNDYEEKMDDEGIFVITVSGRVKDLPKKPIICEHSIRLKQPDLEVSGEVNGSEVKLMVEFENPLEKALTDCEFQVEAPKLVKQFTVKQEDIPAKEKIRREIKFTSRSSGRKTVVVELDSKQLKDINGSVTVEVKLDEPEEEDRELLL